MPEGPGSLGTGKPDLGLPVSVSVRLAKWFLSDPEYPEDAPDF